MVLLAMLVVAVAAAAAAAPSGAPSSTTDAPPRLFNAGYLGSGLNLLSADVNLFDPGQFAAPVYDLQWDQGVTTEDGRWSIPDGTYARGYPSCEWDQTTSKITSTFDYQNWLTESVSSHSSFCDLFSGSTSASYSQYNQFTFDSMKYVYMAHAMCSTYELAYQPFQRPALSSGFLAGVAALPATLNQSTIDTYFTFIEFFGTHVMKSITMGGRMILNIFVSASDFQVMSSQDIDCSAEADVSFIVSAGVDAHGEDKTDKHVQFTKYAEQQALKCLGGEAGNCSYAAWAPSVPSNPVPVGYDLVDLASLFTSDYFPGDGSIALKQAALRTATRMFFQTNGSAPQMYCADASNMAGIQDHTVSVFHGSGAVPTFVQVQNTQVVDRSSSTFYPMEWAFSPTTTNNFIALNADEQNIQLGTYGPADIGGHYDPTSQQWSTSQTGYWTVATMSRAPDFGGTWMAVASKSTPGQVILAQTFDVNKTTLVQVQFAETQEPTVAYPLVWRWGNQQAGNNNPASIIMTNGELSLQMTPGNVFARWDQSVGFMTFSSGYFRANIFTLPADHDSGWVASPAPADTLFSVVHGLGIVPQIVQVFFSPDQGTCVYPVVWNLNSNDTPNPVSISVDRHVISIAISHGSCLFRSYLASTAAWQCFTSGYWRTTAFLSPALLPVVGDGL